MTRTERDDPPWSILERGTGAWSGEETMPPAPWAPNGLEAIGTLSAKLVFGGRGLVSDYTQEVNGEVSLTSHTVIRWDDERDLFVMHFFTGPGEPSVMEGRRDGDRLIFEGQGPGGPMRQTVEYRPDAMRVVSEGPPEETGDRTKLFEGRYTRSSEA